jgi:copper chaperone CopZ
VCVVVLGLALPGAARAQPADTETDEARARRHFETGASLYLEENYEGAAAEFEASYALRPVPVVLFNLAQTYRRLYRYGDAVDAYERYLRTESDLTTERRTAVRTTIAELRRGLAPVSETDVSGAEILVDGRSVGTTPLEAPLALAAGTRVIEARLDGHAPAREEIRVIGGEAQTVVLSLPEARGVGILRVRSNVASATVRIDGEDRGVAPIEQSVAAGGHDVEVAADGYDTFRREIVLAPQQERELFAELTVTRPLHEQWWFWAAVGGAAVVTLVVVIAVAASSSGQPEPGTLGTVMALERGPWAP